MLADVSNGFPIRNPVQDGETRQNGACPTDPARAGDLHSSIGSVRQRLVQCGGGVDAVGWQPELRPAKPSALPVERWWLRAEHVERELGKLARWKGIAQSATADQASRR